LKRLLAGRISLILLAFSSRSLRLVGVAERLRAVASDSLQLSLGEDPLGGDGGPGGPWPSSEDDVSVALELSSSYDVGFDPEEESSEDDEGTALAGSSLRTDLPFVTLLVFLTFLVLSPDLRRDLATRRSSSWESILRRASTSSTNLSSARARDSLVCSWCVRRR